MPPLRNSRQEKFCLEYFNGKSGQKAAVNAGYSPRSAHVTASRLLTKANIANRISELQKEATSSEVMTVREQKEILTKIFRATIADFAESDKNGLTVRVRP